MMGMMTSLSRNPTLILFWMSSMLFVYFYVEWRLSSVANSNNYVPQAPPILSQLSQIDKCGGPMESMRNENMVIVYNRVPKTASTTFMGITQDIAKRFGIADPIYINIIREPLERMVSYFYFLRFGDKFRPGLKRRRQGDTETFDACVSSGGRDCNENHFWLQIPFFCGHAPECWNPGSKWALAEAKRNLLHKYLLVGVTDLLPDFIAMLESIIPNFFHGATQLYLTGTKSRLRETKQKFAPSVETVAKVEKSEIYLMEREFYDFTRQYFLLLRNRMLAQAQSTQQKLTTEQLQTLAGVKIGFHYDKIRPHVR